MTAFSVPVMFLLLKGLRKAYIIQAADSRVTKLVDRIMI
jgi:hypothetical protein